MIVAVVLRVLVLQDDPEEEAGMACERRKCTPIECTKFKKRINSSEIYITINSQWNVPYMGRWSTTATLLQETQSSIKIIYNIINEILVSCDVL